MLWLLEQNTFYKRNKKNERSNKDYSKLGVVIARNRDKITQCKWKYSKIKTKEYRFSKNLVKDVMTKDPITITSMLWQ